MHIQRNTGYCYVATCSYVAIAMQLQAWFKIRMQTLLRIELIWKQKLIFSNKTIVKQWLDLLN